MYTYGYLREATMAHCDLEEEELQAMNVLKRLHIFANEAMHAVCAVKPKYTYFTFKVVKEYRPIIEQIINNEIVYREASEEELPFIYHDYTDIKLADEIATREYYTNRNIFLVNEPIAIKNNFIAFTNKQSFVIEQGSKFDSEKFVNGDWTTNVAEVLRPVKYGKELVFGDNNTIIALVEGTYKVPYKAVWHLFTSAMPDQEKLDIPVDILNCLPLYMASIILQIDYAQKAQIKRSEFELALTRVTNTDNMPVNRITPSF